jgi:hypothetical protein
MSAPIRTELNVDAAMQEFWRIAETDDTEKLEHILAGMLAPKLISPTTAS